jgi:UDP-glucuronate decarboxylase
MRSNDGRVIPNFVMQALKNEDITVYGDGKQTRSFCYVTDMVDGLIRFMESGRVGDVINLGNPDERKVIDVANTIKKMTNSGSKIAFLPLPKDDPARRKPDIRKAKEKLEWEPRVAFERGLEKTIEWFKTNI